MKAFFKSVAQWFMFCMLSLVFIPIAIVLGIMQEIEDRKNRSEDKHQLKFKWKLKDRYFKGANTYKYTLKLENGTTNEISITVDENGSFELNEAAPAGFYLYARQSPNHGNAATPL